MRSLVGRLFAVVTLGLSGIVTANADIVIEQPWHPAPAAYRSMLFLADLEPVVWDLALEAYEKKHPASDIDRPAKTYFAALSGGAQSDIFVMACNQALLNDRPAALTLLNQLLTLRRTRYIEPFQFVGIYAYLGDTERAFEWLERAYEERSYWMPTLKVHPMVDSLRGDPRFAALLARMRLE